VLVDRLSRVGDRFLIEAGSQRFEANEVVVAMANYQTPRIPDFAPELDAGVLQLHANDYKRPTQLRDGSVLVVGLGNSGADIAMDVAETHQTFLAGTESGVIPWRIEGVFGRNVMGRVMRFVGHRVFSIDTPIGRKARPAMLHRAAPLIRVKPQDLIAAGIERVGRVDGVRDGQPLLADGRALDVANVIWCTGFHHSFAWIDLPVLSARGEPRHVRGVAPRARHPVAVQNELLVLVRSWE
jgi:putative flavoprotein involved in K+ transport